MHFWVYKLTAPNGHAYVGVASNPRRRWQRHVSAAVRGSVLPLHRAIRKHGPEAFAHDVLEHMTTKAGALRAEQLWIARLGTFGNGYNATAGGRGALGLKHTDATRARMAAAHLGRDPASYTAGLAAAATPEARAKSRRAKQGKPPACAPLAWAANRGRGHSDETRAKMRLSALRRWGARG